MTKIMIVEDDKALREIYSIRLVAEGYNVVSAGDGEEALAMAVRERPELIISDVMMPKISGFDMLDIIRSTPETKDIKVIMMTALSTEDQRKRGENLGADRYLVKSQVGIEDVVNAVHEVLGDRPAADGIQNINTLASLPQTPAAPAPAAAPAAQPAPAPQPAPIAPQPVPTPAPMPVEPQPAPAPAPAEPVQPTPAPQQPAAPVAPPPPAQQPPMPEPAAPIAQPVAPTPPATQPPVQQPVAPTPQPAPAEPQPAPAPAPAEPVQPTPAPQQPAAPVAPPAPTDQNVLGERVIQPIPKGEEQMSTELTMEQRVAQELGQNNAPAAQ